MKSWQSFRQGNKELFQHWTTYLAIIWGSTAIVISIATLLFTYFTNWLLKVSEIPYLSYRDLGQLAAANFWVALILLLEIVIMLLIIYGQFVFIVVSVANLRQQHPDKFTATLHRTVTTLKKAAPTAFFIFLGDFVVVLPLAGFLLSTPLINKLKIPGPILDGLIQNPLYAAGIGLIYLVLIYFALRFLLMLPLMLLRHLPAKQAGQLSWQKTKGRLSFYLGNLVLILGTSLLLRAGIYLFVYFVQKVLDQTPVAVPGVISNLFIMELVAELTSCYLIALMAQLLVSQTDTSTAQLRKGHARSIFNGLVGIIVVTTTAGIVTHNVLLLNKLTFEKPLVISHRGVDNGNGVQNTIPALKATSKEKPDYVEIDVQQTKDRKFVVLHDDNLKELAGINKTPAQLTLKELTKITVRENGKQAKLASFDDYLTAAAQLKQKLLVEIKATPQNSKDMTKIFIQRYQQRLLQHDDLVQTLSYPVVTQLKQKAPKLFVSFILPYNLTFPKTKANGYTMEATTLNAKFIRDANQRDQQVYAWTVNKPNQMDHMMFLGVDAIITDQLHELKQQVKQNQQRPNYASLLLALMIQLDSSEANKTN